jgi:hypothetical protein
MIKFGSRVVCINDLFSDEQIAIIPNRPVKDEQYTIDEVMITRRGKAVTLVEIDNPPLTHPTGLGTFQNVGRSAGRRGKEGRGSFGVME